MRNLKHESDLDWYFSNGTCKFFSSPIGAMLEAQHSKYLDPVKGEERGGTSRRGAGRAGDGKFTAEATDDPTYFATDWSYMHVKAEEHHQPEEPELSDLHRFGHVSSALYKLEKFDPIYTSTLMAFFGDLGGKYAAARVEGRLLAVYALTETGSKWAAFMAKNSDLQLRPDERLATECFQQDKAPEDVRRARLKKVDTEARELCRNAMAKYSEFAE